MYLGVKLVQVYINIGWFLSLNLFYIMIKTRQALDKLQTLEHSHQLLYKCVKYTFWPFLHILNQKTHYISPFKIVYNHLKFSTSYSTRVNLHGHCSMCIQFFINFRLHQFFSLFSVHNDLNSSSSFPQMHTNTPTHKHIHTKKSTQRYTC